MKYLNATLSIFCIIAASVFIIPTQGVSGNNTDHDNRKVIQFHRHVTWEEVEAYADDWKEMGVDVVMRLPLINGLVVMVPGDVEVEDLAYDPRVAGVEGDQRLRLEEDMNGQTGSFIRPVPNIADGLSPWGRLKLYTLPHFSPLDEFVEADIPRNIEKALEKLNNEIVRVAVFDTGIST